MEVVASWILLAKELSSSIGVGQSHFGIIYVKEQKSYPTDHISERASDRCSDGAGVENV